MSKMNGKILDVFTRILRNGYYRMDRGYPKIN